MKDILSRNKLIIGIVVVVIAIGAWWGLRGSSETPLLTTETVTSAADNELITTLIQLRAVTLSGTIFSDPAFMSLRDFGIQIVPEPVGRPNPFAPLSAAQAPTPNTTKEAQIFAPGKK